MSRFSPARSSARRIAVAALTAAGALAASSSPALALDPATPATTASTTIPGTSRVVDEWKLVGRGSASAIQIAPQWTLSSGHAGIAPGASFANSYGSATVVKQFEPVNKEYTAGDIDLKLQLLDRPINAPSYPAILSQYVDPDTLYALPGAQLSVGYGATAAGLIPTVGWSDAASNALPGGGPAPSGVDGDSGGAVFWYPSASAPAVLGAVIKGQAPTFIGFQQKLGGVEFASQENIRSFMRAAFTANPSATPPRFTGLDEVLPPVTGARPTPVTGTRLSSPGASAVTISWTNPTGGATRTGFKVFLNDTLKTTVTSASATSVRLTGLSWTTRYRVRVAPIGPSGAAYPSVAEGDTTIFTTRWLF